MCEVATATVPTALARGYVGLDNDPRLYHLIEAVAGGGRLFWNISPFEIFSPRKF